MQLITTIPPRRDGVVFATSPDGRKKFAFKPDDAGQLACDVDDEATVAHLLGSENFYPLHDVDFAAALALTNPGSAGVASADGGAAGSDADEAEEADEAADEGSPDGAPLEAGTQPVLVTPASLRRVRSRA